MTHSGVKVCVGEYGSQWGVLTQALTQQATLGAIAQLYVGPFPHFSQELSYKGQ